MCSMSVLKCPLCAQTSFPSIDALRGSLIKAANGPLACPICHELFLGLDKLTIHLFSHTAGTITAATTAEQQTAQHVTSITTTTTTTTTPAAASTTAATMLTTKRPSKEKKSKKAKQVSESQKSNDSQAPSYAAHSRSNSTASTLATCDICEFTFRDEELRDMHFRLVHQNSTSDQSSANMAGPTATAAQSEPDFKCHLCAKTFKMKGSLRVHLKVVHFMSLPCTGNSAKLSICDRIRHKETARNASKCTAGTAVQPLQPLQPKTKLETAANGVQLLPHPQPHPTPPVQQIALATNTASVSNGFTIGTLTLLPASTTTTATGSLLNINSNGELVPATDGSGLNSNVLLVFNTNTASVAAATTMAVASGSGDTATTGVSIQPLSTELQMDEPNKYNTDNPKIWECDVCTKSFTTKYFLKKHKRLHTGEMPYTCEICARTFTFQQSYHKHLLYHSNEKPHVCATCGRAFKELSTLHNHERIHSGEKPFKCEVCGKCFRQRVSFLVHTRIHTGVMPYKCEVCQKSFRYKVSQRTHKCSPLQPQSEVASDEANSGNQCKVDGATARDAADHMSESFIKAFLESASTQLNDAQQSPASAEIAGINATDCNGNVDEALLTQTIDDIMVESCNKMGIGSDVSGTAQHLPPTPTQHMRTAFVAPPSDGNDGSNSPSQKLQNMRLYSPQLVAADMVDAVDGVDGIFPRFLLDDVGNGML